MLRFKGAQFRVTQRKPILQPASIFCNSAAHKSCHRFKPLLWSFTIGLHTKDDGLGQSLNMNLKSNFAKPLEKVKKFGHHSEPHALATKFAIQNFPQSLQEFKLFKGALVVAVHSLKPHFIFQCITSLVSSKKFTQSTFTPCMQSNISGSIQNL